MTMRYAHLTPGYLSTEVSLLDGIGQTPKGKKRATISSVDTVQHETIKFSEELGAPSTTRTCDLLVRSQTLYPTELWARRCCGPMAHGPASSTGPKLRS